LVKLLRLLYIKIYDCKRKNKFSAGETKNKTDCLNRQREFRKIVFQVSFRLGKRAALQEWPFYFKKV